MRKLKEIRKSRGLTQLEVSQKLRIARTTYTEWERGINEPSIDKLLELAIIFGCSVDDIIGNEKSANSFNELNELARIISELPQDKQKQVMDFIRFLKDQG